MQSTNRLFVFLIFLVLSTFSKTYSEQNQKVTILDQILNDQIRNGIFENGVSYDLISTSLIKEGLWIQLSFPFNNELELNEIELAARAVTESALFFGTKNFDRQDIENQFDQLGLDILPFKYWKNDEERVTFEIYVESNNFIKVHTILNLIHDIFLFPNLTLNEIEQAKIQLIDYQANVETFTHKITHFESVNAVTSKDIENAYFKFFNPKNLKLTILSSLDADQIEQLLFAIYGKKSTTLINENINKKNLSNSLALMQTIRHSDNAPTWVIDEKIWMNEPNWINKQKNGRILGIGLGFISIGSLASLLLETTNKASLTVAAKVTGGMVCAAISLYYLLSDYFKDPKYVERQRKIDLKEQFSKVYKSGRAGLTLTPLERRSLFLKEMVNQTNKYFWCLPINLLTNHYQLHDPILMEIFTTEELDYLIHFKQVIIHQKNNLSSLKKDLENELIQSLQPFLHIKDLSIELAKTRYDNDQYIQLKKTYELERNTKIKEIQELFNEKKISENVQNEKIKQIKKYYVEYFSSPEFTLGQAFADNILKQSISEATHVFDIQTIACKNRINYDERKKAFEEGMSSLLTLSNRDLIDILKSFPVYLSTIRDDINLASN
ncbi:MAG: hypothetical protein Q8K60_04850 [Parachlamydiaceae bacterium]|nr:hypothetical protein [Parachlamydiaceae bacterium]